MNLYGNNPYYTKDEDIARRKTVIFLIHKCGDKFKESLRIGKEPLKCHCNIFDTQGKEFNWRGLSKKIVALNYCDKALGA